MALAVVVSANMLCQFNHFASVIIQVAMFLSHSEGALLIQEIMLNAIQKSSVYITAHVGGIFERRNCLSFRGARRAYPNLLMYRRLKYITKSDMKGTLKSFSMVHSNLFASLVTLLKRPRKLDGISDPPFKNVSYVWSRTSVEASARKSPRWSPGINGDAKALGWVSLVWGGGNCRESVS